MKSTTIQAVADALDLNKRILGVSNNNNNNNKIHVGLL